MATEPVPTSKPAPRKAEQDQQMANLITKARQKLETARDGAEMTARSAYADFRQIAGGVFTNAADRAAVGLKGVVPDDMQKFITLARASYTAAQSEPYQSALAVYGYSKEMIDAAIATLDEMTTAIETQASAAGAAVQSTAARNKAVRELGAWMRMFVKVAGVTFKNRPDLRKKLGL